MHFFSLCCCLHEAWPLLCLPCVSQLSFKLVMHLKWIQQIFAQRKLGQCQSVERSRSPSKKSVWIFGRDGIQSICQWSAWQFCASRLSVLVCWVVESGDLDANGAKQAPRFLYAPGIWTSNRRGKGAIPFFFKLN